jgi:hypothetical protein
MSQVDRFGLRGSHSTVAGNADGAQRYASQALENVSSVDPAGQPLRHVIKTLTVHVGPLTICRQNGTPDWGRSKTWKH